MHNSPRLLRNIMMHHVAYYYQETLFTTPEGNAQHQQICDLLSQLHATGRFSKYVIREAEAEFPNEEARQALFAQLREFAARHKVALARTFGSRRHGFCYLPAQFLLVREDNALREVFPCQIGDEVQPLEYLRQIAANRPWTTRSAKGMEGKKHAALIAQIVAKPDILEPGLTLRGTNVQVSRDFGELGFVDLVFNDCDGAPLLVEVKVEPDELDKATGQILRHRKLFATQNRIPEPSIRIGVACPYIPSQYRSVFQSVGISWFELSLSWATKIHKDDHDNSRD